MVKKLNLLAAILAGLTTAEVSAGGNHVIPGDSVGLKSEVLLEQPQSGSVDLKEIEPLYLVETIRAEEMYQQILSYLSAKETLRLSLSSKGMLAGVKQSTGLYFSPLSFNDYSPLFKKMLIEKHPQIDKKFVSALWSHFNRGDERNNPITLMRDKLELYEPSKKSQNIFLLSEFLTKYSRKSIRKIYAKLLESSNQHIDPLVEIFKTNLSIVQAINKDFLESVSVQSFKEQLRPYVRFYDQIVNEEYKIDYIQQSNKSDEMKAFGFLMLAQDERVHRVEAAEFLVKLGDEYKDTAAQVCLSIAQDESLNSDYRVEAAELLVDLGDEYKDTAAQICLSIAQDVSVDSYGRMKAAMLLVDLGDEYKDTAAQAYLSIAQDKKLKGHERIEALEILSFAQLKDGMLVTEKRLAKLREEYKDTAAQICLSIAQDVSVASYPAMKAAISDNKMKAARLLVDLGDDYKDTAAQAYLSIAQGVNVDSYHRVHAAKLLVKLGDEYKDTAAQICLSIAQDVSVDSDYRVEAAVVLARLGEEYKDMAAQVCLSIAQDVSVNSYCRAEAARRLLYKFGEEYEDTAARAYRLIVHDVSADSYYRVEAARVLSKFGEEYKDTAAQVCLSIAQDESVDLNHRLKAVELLANKFGIVIDI